MSSQLPIYEIKRILEIKSSNLYPREEFFEHAAEIMESHHAIYDPELIQILREKDAVSSDPLFAEYKKSFDDKLLWRDSLREKGASSDPNMRLWRERQMKRCVLEIGESQCRVITFPPLAFELAQGCSVNCWFCALNAGPLRQIFPYTQENETLWKGILEAAKAVIGPAVQYAVSYWATEPLDNKDYEKFCGDMADILGLYPQTTTATALRDVERTRRLLADSYARGCRVNRFSVHDGGQLLKIHQSFTAEELANTELILENSESSNTLVRSGRLFDLEHRMPDKAREEDERLIRSTFEKTPELKEKFKEVVVNTSCRAEPAGAGGNEGKLQINIPGTTACMAGFLIKMPSKTVELISPCAADEENPMGYIIHDKGEFDSPEEFKALLQKLIEKNMIPHILPEHRVALTKRFRYEELEHGFAMCSVFAKVQFENQAMGDYLKRIGELLHAGRSRAGEIAMECFYVFGKQESLTYRIINSVYSNGLLDESCLGKDR